MDLLHLDPTLIGDEQRERIHERFSALLVRSDISHVEIWDYDLHLMTVSVLLSAKEKARYYMRLGLLLVYTYADEARTRLSGIRTMRLLKADNTLRETDIFTKEINYLIQESCIAYFSIYLHRDLLVENVLPVYRFLHTVPPFMQDEADDIVKQDKIIVPGPECPICYNQILFSVVEVDGVLYLVRIHLKNFTHPRSILSMKEQSRNVYYSRIRILPLVDVVFDKRYYGIPYDTAEVKTAITTDKDKLKAKRLTIARRIRLDPPTRKKPRHSLEDKTTTA